jgi:hypothetical protein
MVEDYAYVGKYLCGDLDLALPKGSQWGDIDEKENFHYMILLIF